MIESQLKPEGISCQSTLNCIEKVNREDFVPVEYKKLAYAEYDIPLKNNFKIITLEVRETQKRAIQIYNQAGFKKCGENPKSVLINKKYYSGYYFYKDID